MSDIRERHVQEAIRGVDEGVDPLPMLREMAMACYRRGILAEGECLDLLAVLTRAESE
jgi:hypothetical protein